MSVEEAAYAALTIATENVIGAIREITIAQGIDPREYSLVAGGGASGLNVVPIARELGSPRVLLPATAGALSACGALFSDVISEFSRSRYAETRTLDADAVNEVLADIEARADAFLADLADIDPVATRKEFTVEARYRAQIWELDVPIPSRIVDGGVTALEDAFHETHERVFAVREPGQYLECLLWKVRATAVPRKPAVHPRAAATGAAEPAARRARVLQGDGARARAELRRRRAAARRAHRGPGADPRADDDDRRLPRLDGDGQRARQLPAGGAAVSLDPVLLAVIANRMDSIVREMENTLLRSGRSAVLNLARDFSCALITGDSRLLASAEGLPVHVIGMEFLAQGRDRPARRHPATATPSSTTTPTSATRTRPTTSSSSRSSGRATTSSRPPPRRTRPTAATRSRRPTCPTRATSTRKAA